MIVMATIKDDLRDNILPDQLRVRSGLERDINILMRLQGVERQTGAFQCFSRLPRRNEEIPPSVGRKKGGKTRNVSQQRQAGVFREGVSGAYSVQNVGLCPMPTQSPGKLTTQIRARGSRSVNECLDSASGRRHRGIWGD